MNIEGKVFVAGHTGLVGSAIVRALKRSGFTRLALASIEDIDLRDPVSVRSYYERERPDYVIIAAAKVGGIHANRTYPAEFIYDNLMIQNNLIHNAYLNQVKKLLFLGSSCIYPRECPQPMKEEYIMTGPLEPTNESYALAKLAGIRMAKAYSEQYKVNYISVLPCNLYGPGDSFDLQNSHVLSALVRRFSDAISDGKGEVVLWGTGIARREFMWVDDMAEACVVLMQKYDSPEIINVGTGTDVTIRELAELIAVKTGFTGKLVWDANMPDGMLRKCLDISRMREYGVEHRISLEEGVVRMIAEYQARKPTLRRYDQIQP